MKKYLVILIFLSVNGLFAQNFVTINPNFIELDNNFVHKKIALNQDSIFANELFISGDTNNFILKSKEFSFLLNEKPVSGFSGWKVVKKEKITDNTGGQGIKISLVSTRFQEKIQLEIHYLLYPELPLIRKWIKFSNTGKKEFKIENLNIEDIHTVISHVKAVVHHNYARMKHLGRFVGKWHDPVVVVHDFTHRRGIAVGNESPGILKRIAYHTANNNIEAGLTHSEQDYPFRKWLQPGESWESPKIFICPYHHTDNGFDVINNEVNHFIVKHMNTRIIQNKEKPTFVYNTWNPFRTFVNDSLIREVAKSAAECGVQEFIIDDGWQINIGAEPSDLAWGKNYGDWQVDTTKFPQGLKPTFDYIRSLGMKPGLWISIGAATSDSKVFQNHPEWFVRDKHGKSGNLHYTDKNSGFYTSCYGTGWVDYIKNTIIRLVDEYGLAYAKLDFSVVTSAYINNKEIAGCYAKNHPYHKDQEESFIVIYERLLQMFDELEKAAPELFIDCTFETAGKLQLMDYAIAKHAEGNWLSNFEESAPTGALRVRHMAWWRSPALPASSLVIGNLPMDDENFEFGLKSLIGTLPIVLGDPRKMATEKQNMIQKWSVWMQEMQEKYDYMSYRKDLPGFGEPREGAWDGWMRINFQSKKGGIFGVFRQGAADKSRTVVLNDLQPGKIYTIHLAPTGQQVVKATGQELMEKGYKVDIDNEYGAKIFEVRIE